MQLIITTPEQLQTAIEQAVNRALANLPPIERKSEEVYLTPEEVYLTPEEVAEKLKITKSTLWAWDKSGITKPLRIGKLKRYRISELDAVFERIPSVNEPRRIKKN